MAAGDDLRISATLVLPAAELAERFVTSAGPGGQNVNKVASKVELRWCVRTSRAIGEGLRALLSDKLATKLTQEGELIVTASEHRDQWRNRADARDKLAAMLRAAMVRPKKRFKTKPTRGSKERRLKEKKTRGERKRDRGWRD